MTTANEHLVPDWARDRTELVATTTLAAKRATRQVTSLAIRAPATLVRLVAWSPRGLGRVVAMLARYLYDHDTATARHEHAGRGETSEYVKLHNARKANLKARWLVATTLAMLVATPTLAILAPTWLAGLVGLVVGVWIVKLIPGRGVTELAIAGAVGGGIWWFLPTWLATIPTPPWWSLAALAGALVVPLGVIGRPRGKPVMPDRAADPTGGLEKPRADVTTRALCTLGIKGLNDPEEIRLLADVARSGRGYHIGMELPEAVTAAAVMEKREELAAALRREIGTVWPSKGPRHPGHLDLYLGDEPMATAKQKPWPVATRGRVDVFEPLPLFTDQQGRWVDLTLAYKQVVVGGAPGFGKTFGVRSVACAVALDPRVRVLVIDGKGAGDMAPLGLVAEGYYVGDEPEDIAEQLAALKAIREEMRRRNKFIRSLTRAECPESKVTSVLVDTYPALAPILLVVDEVQTLTEHDDKKVKDEFRSILTDLVKRGRAAGIIPIFSTQKPDAAALPTGISSNCSTRLCFKVNDHNHVDQVLGTGSHKSGLRPNLFTDNDRGVAYLKGDGQEPQIVRTVHGLDAVAAEEMMLTARKLRESKGLLTGYAAGEDAQREADQVDLLEDCREVMDEARVDRVHLRVLAERLADHRPVYEHLDGESLGAQLRAAGVPIGQVKVEGRNTSGIRRVHLNVTATDDVDPDEVSGEVVPIR